jgi:Polyketide cyclase / dehydrase and lipid transport
MEGEAAGGWGPPGLGSPVLVPYAYDRRPCEPGGYRMDADRPAREVAVRTRWVFDAPPRDVWPLLCASKMGESNFPLVKLGVPKPLECRLPGGQGGAGSERECVSDQGVVHQRIIEWIPTERLSFRMERTDLAFRDSVVDLVDTFDLVPTVAGVAVTRITRARVTGRFKVLRGLMLRVGVKQVHRFVFANWQRLAEAKHNTSS